MMTFQAGDHVLWWGEGWRIVWIDQRGIRLGFGPGDSHWTDRRTLAAHQRPWRYDAELFGWVPDEPRRHGTPLPGFSWREAEPADLMAGCEILCDIDFIHEDAPA